MKTQEVLDKMKTQKVLDILHDMGYRKRIHSRATYVKNYRDYTVRIYVYISGRVNVTLDVDSEWRWEEKEAETIRRIEEILKKKGIRIARELK